MKLELAVDKMINGEVHIHVATKKMYNKLMKYLDSKGIVWADGHKATEHDFFKDYVNFGIFYNKEDSGLLYFNNEYPLKDNIETVDIDSDNEETEEDDVLAGLLKKAGIEKNKPFYVDDNPGFTLYNPYVYNGNDVLDNETDPIDEAVLLGIILGKLKVRAGFPQVGDTYHFVDISGNIACKKWADKTVDYAMMYMGNVFPSHSVAFNRAEEFKHIYKELKNK